MTAWYATLTGMEKVYFYCAFIGGLLFLFRVVMVFLAGAHGAHDGGLDADHAGYGGSAANDVSSAEDVHSDSDVSFKVLTLQGLTAFFAVFGLMGLALKRESGFGETVSLFGALAAGYGAMYAVAKLFALFLGLQSSGTMDITNAIGAEGEVYLSIPEEGTGKVRITIQDTMRVLSATTTGEALKTGDHVKVTEVVSGTLLKVVKID